MSFTSMRCMGKCYHHLQLIDEELKHCWPESWSMLFPLKPNSYLRFSMVISELLQKPEVPPESPRKHPIMEAEQSGGHIHKH